MNTSFLRCVDLVIFDLLSSVIIYILFFVLVQYMHRFVICRCLLAVVSTLHGLFSHGFLVSKLESYYICFTTILLVSSHYCRDVAENQAIGFHMCGDETEWRCCGRWFLLYGLL